MRRLKRLGWIGAVLSAGCWSGPQADNPVWLRTSASAPQCENPIVIAPGPANADAYARVFEHVLSVVGDYFEIAYANRRDGRIVGQPRVAPGIEQPWRPGTPDSRERLLATLQTMRNRCFVQIRAAEGGGYTVQVTVYRDLLDDPKPTIPSAGSATLRDFNTVDRTFEVVDPSTPVGATERWISKGRDPAFEQAILQQIQRCQ